MTQYQFLNITIANKVAHVQINRPEKRNALNDVLWQEFRQAFTALDADASVRAIVLEGNGNHFCAGIDLSTMVGLAGSLPEEEGRKREALRKLILNFQDSFTAMEKCRKPVLAAIHGGCVGAGVDMISACDIRYATLDASFVIKEIDIGMTADVGTLQRLPHLIPDGLVRELAYTGREMKADEALRCGLVNKVYGNKEEMIADVLKIAQTIAEKSPLSIRGTKQILLYTRDHTVADSLDYVATWNAATLFSADLMEAMGAQMEKRKAEFED
jgi:enoyl-CoA hydratase